jgi:hypothetical protein
MPRKLTESEGAEVTKLLQGREPDAITPEELVRAAKHKRSPLHRLFTWDDAEAGHTLRMHEARHVMEAYKVFMHTGTHRSSPEVLRVVAGAVSCGEGYRLTMSVMSDKQSARQQIAVEWARLRGYIDRVAGLASVASEFATHGRWLEEIIKEGDARFLRTKAARKRRKRA